VIFGIGAMVTQQVAQLAENLPRYQITIGNKIESLRGAASENALVEKVSNALGGLRQQLTKPTSPSGGSSNPAPSDGTSSSGEQKPIPVEIRQPPLEPLQIIRNIISPVLAPLATAGIVIIFAIFILLYRQDLRDRFIRLAGMHDLGRTTEAIDDAASRLSRYFLTQTAINACFGFIIGMGLWLIGIPNPFLWGIFGALMRFVPYIGAFIAAALPAALAIAVDPGWWMLVWTLALFLIVEPIMGQVVEPWLYGHNTGLSPIAVIVAATFWTWLWGPIGLLLSTPLTVCLVVLGRHVKQLEFFEVILGDEPALSPEENFYQRMLAGDPHEAADQAEQFLKEQSLSAFYDEVAVPGLALAQADLSRGLLEAEKLTSIRDTVQELVDDLSDHDDQAPTTKSSAQTDEAVALRPSTAEDDRRPVPEVLATEELAPGWREQSPVLCIGGRTALDDAAAAMLAQLIEKHGLGARFEPRETLATANIFSLKTDGVRLVCLSYLDMSRPTEVRYLVRRLRRRIPNVLILVGSWQSKKGKVAESDTALSNLQSATGAEFYATSFRQAIESAIEAARIKAEVLEPGKAEPFAHQHPRVA
jgi:predicted PurR-regulated permease PerM